MFLDFIWVKRLYCFVCYRVSSFTAHVVKIRSINAIWCKAHLLCMSYRLHFFQFLFVNGGMLSRRCSFMDERFYLAVSLITHAKLSRLAIIPKRDRKSIRLYNIYYNKYLITTYFIFMFVNLCTILLEEPAAIWISGGPIHYYYPLFINVVCESFFYFRWFQMLKFADISKMKRDVPFWGTLIMLILMSLGDVTLILQKSLLGMA